MIMHAWLHVSLGIGLEMITLPLEEKRKSEQGDQGAS